MHLDNTRITYNTDRECGEIPISYHAEYTVGQPERYLTTHHERDPP